MSNSPINEVKFDSITAALADLAAGKPILVFDNYDRENESDIIFAAEAATSELVSFLVRYSSGYVCAAMPIEFCDRLNLTPMYYQNQDKLKTSYTVTVDAKENITTGISARDRAQTLRMLANPNSKSSDLVRPGHVVPLRSAPFGVLERKGHTEATVDLLKLSGLSPVGVLAELVSEIDPTRMANLSEAKVFADKFDMKFINIDQIIKYRKKTELFLTKTSSAQLPTRYGRFTVICYTNNITGVEHLVMLKTSSGGFNKPPLVRIHSECITGDILGSLRCDCGSQLHAALTQIDTYGYGALVYLRDQEGRGIGIGAKLKAYQLQDNGRDTLDANLELDYPIDSREYSQAAQMLHDLNINNIILLSNNPIKAEELSEFGIQITERRSLTTGITEENINYLITKRDRMGHDFPINLKVGADE